MIEKSTELGWDSLQRLHLFHDLWKGKNGRISPMRDILDRMMLQMDAKVFLKHR